MEVRRWKPKSETKKIRTHLRNNPWLREPYDELLRLAGEIPALKLNPGADETELGGEAEKLRENAVLSIPEDWLSFLALINGFDSPHATIYPAAALKGKIDDPDTQYHEIDRYLPWHPKHRTKWPITIELGRSDHGAYLFQIYDSSYEMRLNDGSAHFFDDCLGMIWHIIHRIRAAAAETMKNKEETSK